MPKSFNDQQSKGLYGILIAVIFIILLISIILNKTAIIRQVLLFDGSLKNWNGLNVQLAKDNFFVDSKRSDFLIIGTFSEASDDVAMPLDATLTVVKNLTLKGYRRFLEAECNIANGCQWRAECFEAVPESVECLTVEGKLPREIKGTFHVFYGVSGADISIIYDGDKNKIKYFSHEISSIFQQIQCCQANIR
jgi:hypothetical protein